MLGRTAAIINYGDTSNINDGDTNDDGDEKVSALESELESAETITATTRSALADAEAALRHASEAVQAHAGMERLGEVRRTRVMDLCIFVMYLRYVSLFIHYIQYILFDFDGSMKGKGGGGPGGG